MKKTTLILGVILFSSCGIQFGDYERYKEVHRNNICQEEITQEDYYADCENCDEVD